MRELQDLQTERNRRRDLTGSLQRISTMRSNGSSVTGGCCLLTGSVRVPVEVVGLGCLVVAVVSSIG